MAKTKITKEEILEASFQITREHGIEAVTAKSIAANLHCSTQPVYWAYDTMENLRKEIVERAIAYYFAYVAKPIPGIPANKASGLAYIHFAKEEKQLFRLLYMPNRSDAPDFSYDKMKPNDDLVLHRLMEATGFSEEKVIKMYTDLWIFSHGIATMIATGSAVFSEESISQMLTDVYEGLKWKIGNEEDKDE